MLFADFFNELFGSACLMFIAVIWLIGWVLTSIGNAAKEALKNDTVQQAARVGFWAWFLSDDD
jgi:hypothetical protein